MKKYTKVIDSCEICPARKRISVSNYGCSSMNGVKIKDGSIIQEWCPLPDLVKKVTR